MRTFVIWYESKLCMGHGRRKIRTDSALTYEESLNVVQDPPIDSRPRTQPNAT